MSKVSGSAHVDLQGTMLVATLLLHHWLGLSLMPSSGVLPQGVLLSQDVVCLPAYCLIEFMYVCMCVLNVFHLFSFVCFVIYSVNRFNSNFSNRAGCRKMM